MKTKARVLTFVLGLSLLTSGCAYFRPTESHETLEMQQADQLKSVSQGDKDLQDMVYAAWNMLASFTNR